MKFSQARLIKNKVEQIEYNADFIEVLKSGRGRIKVVVEYDQVTHQSFLIHSEVKEALVTSLEKRNTELLKELWDIQTQPAVDVEKKEVE